jgi:hypothetical protein
MKFIPEEKPTFFSDTSIFVKLLFVALVCVVIFLVVRMFLQKKDPAPKTVTLKRANMSVPLIHIGIHAYKCDPLPIAQTIFGAFEAAEFPNSVHIHIYQEINSQDYVLDAFQTYKKYYLDKHTYKTNYLDNIHVKNANASDSAGPLVGFLILAKDLILNSNYTVQDQCLFLRPFYETSTSTSIYGVTFVQNFDVRLRNFDPQSMVYSTKFPRTSMTSDDVLHRVQTQAKNASITGLLLSNVAIPLMKNKMHGVHLVNDNVCTLDSWESMIEKQAGFTAWSTIDKCMAQPSIYARTKKSSRVPVPFTIFRTFVHSREVPDTTNEIQDTKLYEKIVPIGGIHDNMQFMNIETLRRMVSRALHHPEYVVAVPYHAYTLMLSNLIGPALYSANHLAIGVIADHTQNVQNQVQSIKNTMAYRPFNWKMVPRLRKGGKNKKKKPIVDLVPCNDFERILPMDSTFKDYAGICSKNITIDAFLGITANDSQNSILLKYRMPENFARRRRMLGEV